MSYDVSIGSEGFNYTSNMAQFFRDFGVYPPDWKGRSRAEVAAEINAALLRIMEIPTAELAEDYDAPNGWGDVTSAIEFLTKVRDAGLAIIPNTVEVSW